jgi:hypothetical protein
MPSPSPYRWLLIPGATLAVFLLFALGAAWVTRFLDAPVPATAPPEAPPEAARPQAPPPPPEPPREAAPSAPPRAEPAPAVQAPPPPTGGPDTPDPRRVEWVEPLVESSTGDIDPADVRVAIAAVTPLVQQCFEDAAQRNRGGQEVKLRFTVAGEGEAGKLDRGELLGSTIPDPMVQACVLDSLLDARFPPPRRGGSATVVYPFRYRVPGDAGP